MMIELFDKREYRDIWNRYKNKIIVILPYKEDRVGVLKKKMKLIRVKGMFYNFVNNSKYSNYDYFVVISLTDIMERIMEVERKIREMLYGDV